jgi:hypothetical protein
VSAFRPRQNQQVANNFASTRQGWFTLNNGIAIAVEDSVINEEEYSYPEAASETFPWRSDPGCELMHEKHQGNRRDGGRSFGQRQSACAKQWSLSPGASLLVEIDDSEIIGVREFFRSHYVPIQLLPLATLASKL